MGVRLGILRGPSPCPRTKNEGCYHEKPPRGRMPRRFLRSTGSPGRGYRPAMRTIVGFTLLALLATPVTGAVTVYRGPLTNPFTGQDGRLTARVQTTGAQLRARLR